MIKYSETITNLNLPIEYLQNHIIEILQDEEYLDETKNWAKCPYCDNEGYQRYYLEPEHFVAFAKSYTHSSFQSIKIKELLYKYMDRDKKKIKVKTCECCKNILTIAGENCYLYHFEDDKICQLPKTDYFDKIQVIDMVNFFPFNYEKGDI